MKKPTRTTGWIHRLPGVAVLLLLLPAAAAMAQEDPASKAAALGQRLEALEGKQEVLERKMNSEILGTESRLDRLEDDIEAVGIALLLSGTFCALWAQYTRRSSWLWFFFGLFLAPVALLVLLWKNAIDLQDGRLGHWTTDKEGKFRPPAGNG